MMKMEKESKKERIKELGLRKLAGLKEDLEFKDYQKRAIDKILENQSLIVSHGTGTGKTVTGVGAFEKLREAGKANKALVVAPSSLKSNFGKHGVEKFTDSKHQIINSYKDEVDPEADYRILSNTMFAKDPQRYLEGVDSLILDEAHNARNQNTKLYKALRDASPQLKNRILLTASPFNNSPGDVSSLINLAHGEELYNQKEFNDKYIKDVNKKFGPLKFLGLGKSQKIGEKFEPDADLKARLQTLFDYEKGGEGMPDVEESVEHVPMTKDQYKAYRYAYNQLPSAVRKAVKRDIIPDKRDSVSFFGSIANARVASNNPASLLKNHKDKDDGYKLSGKALKIVEDMKNKPKSDYGTMVYSNYNKHGADVIQKALEDNKKSVARIDGKMKSKEKDKQVDDFKKGKKDTFITSPTGKEGISLPNVDQEYIFDPNWNPEVTRQAIGRGIRADSKADKVKVKQLIATEPDRKFLGLIPKKKNRSVEEWIHSVAQKKKGLQNQVYQHMGR